MLVLLWPVKQGTQFVISQTFAQHEERARQFGWGTRPDDGKSIKYYGGLDIAAQAGTPILAVHDGLISEVRDDLGGYGSHIRLTFSAEGADWLVVFGHLIRGSQAVKAGQSVRAGEVIGELGNTGNSTGPHLHLEVRRNGYPVDPYPLLRWELGPGVNEEAVLAALPKLEILTDLLNIRAEPWLGGKLVGSLVRGEEPFVLALRTDDEGNVWGQIGWKQWSAIRFRGLELARVVKGD